MLIGEPARLTPHLDRVMRFESNLSPTKMKTKKSADDSGVEELEKKLNDFSLVDSKKEEKNNFEANDLDGCKKEEAEEPIKVKEEIVKKEPEDKVDEAAEALNDLSIEPKTEDNEDEDRVPRGPMRNEKRNTILPYINRHLTVGGTVQVHQVVTPTPQNDLTDEAALEMANFLLSATSENPMALLVLKTLSDSFGVDEGIEEFSGSEGQLSISGSPPQSTTYLYSPGVVSPFSSGYESGTSSPSHSPPRSDENYVPEPIQKINERRTAPRDILPKLDLGMPIQSEFYQYILHLNGNKAENAAIQNYTHRIYWKGSLDKFTCAIPDGDGDTMLMIYLANPKSTQEIAKKMRYTTHQETVFRLFSIFHLVERFHKECPAALEAQNNLCQSVIHLAASNCAEHPLVAAYVAEKLEANNYNFNQNCCAANCFMQGSGNLLHCIAHNGDSHAEVLKRLLQVQKLRELIDSPCHHNAFFMLTPMHVAIKAQNYDPKGALQCLKTVEYLIKEGASFTKKSFSSPKQIALHIALQGKPNIELVELILRYMNATEVNVPDSEDNHPLMILAKASSQLDDDDTFRILTLLLDKGATPKKVATARKQELFYEFNKNIQNTVIQLDVAAALNT
ncbi:Hypothetical predicted protein [Cloeon dipterum]|uniref:Uncharacterized protein n=2 Tax=Cloeon dipterum TaxID=197152 RepID=A0A8S1CQM5_9INSE|nr:Hypothetical predicted protein [Cloeon dipterum]